MENSFEQEFMQNVSASLATDPPKTKQEHESEYEAKNHPGTTSQVTAYTTSNQTAPQKSKLPILIIVILAIALLAESIALAIISGNYFAETNNAESFYEDSEDDTDTESNTYLYDDDGYLIAMELTCTNESGVKYQFYANKRYEQYGQNSELLDSGTYQILEDKIISLTPTNQPNNEKSLYTTGFMLAEGTTVYDCDESLSSGTE